jgi:hypothetical protein
MNILSSLVDTALEIEKLRVASQVRISHLAKRGRQDSDTEELHKRLVDLEKYVDGRVAAHLKLHPAYPWFSHVKGVGRENIGKVIGPVRVAPETDDDGNELPYADTISALWKFAGLSVEDGKAPKRKVGEKLSYNSRLRSMCWRLGSSLLRAKGKFYEYYLSQKEQYEQRYLNNGVNIVPATSLPKKDGKKTEGDGYISEGHVHNQALRKTIKLFLACLWLEWREGLGLPVTKPYAIDHLMHVSFIDPAKMKDKAVN